MVLKPTSSRRKAELKERLRVLKSQQDVSLVAVKQDADGDDRDDKEKTMHDVDLDDDDDSPTQTVTLTLENLRSEMFVILIESSEMH